MSYRYDTYCGLYCGACETLVANEENKVEELAMIRGRKPQDLVCNGCKTSKNTSFCSKCKIKKCAREKNVEFCSECPEYPCPQLLSFRDDQYPHHSIIIKNLDELKKNGPESWLKEQASRWSCPKCGAKYSWYSGKCKQCGSKVFNSRDEEAALKQS